MLEEIKTATGRIYQCSFISEIPSILYITVVGVSLTEVAQVFGDPEETKEIFYREILFSGYSMSAIVKEGDEYRVILEKRP